MRRPSWVLGLAGCVVSSAAVADPAPIIGGTSTTVGQYPSVVAVQVGQGLCTGTLITPEWVLTAAHCVTPSIVRLPDQAAVTASIKVHFATVNLGQSPGTVVRASLSIPKSGFSAQALGSNDIGLIKLATPVTDVVPTPVNLDPATAAVGIQVTMVGFGATQQGGGGSFGVEYALTNRTSTSCTAFGTQPPLQDANVLCFSQSDNKGKCQGDSGGPSFAMIDGKVTVVGVTSFGDMNCAQLGVDTRTDAEREFLLRNIPELQRCETDADCGADHVCFQHACIVTPFNPGGLGAACTTSSECASNMCGEGPGGKYCTQGCTKGAADACPDGLDCVDGGGGGVCWPSQDDDTGCCDTSGRGAPTTALGIALVALRWRRRRS